MILHWSSEFDRIYKIECRTKISTRGERARNGYRVKYMLTEREVREVTAKSPRARIRSTTMTMTTTMLPPLVLFSSAQETCFSPVLHPVHHRVPLRRTIAAYYASYAASRLPTEQSRILSHRDRRVGQHLGDLVNPGLSVSLRRERPHG